MGGLTNEEKESLAKILQAMYGHSVDLVSLKPRFNERTVEAVEKALKAAAGCNANMKDLVASLIGGSSLVASGWLRRMLRKVERKIESDRIKVDGFACRVVGLSKWKSEIALTTYY